VARLAEGLVTPYHGCAILSGAALALSLVWPEAAPTSEVGAFVRGPFFPGALAFLLGILALQVGEAERGHGAYPPLPRVGRLAAHVALGVALVLPFLLVHRVEAGVPWAALGGLLAFLLLYGLFWGLAGYGISAAVHWPGLRFALKYGSYLVVAFAFPTLTALSPFPAVGELWGQAGWRGVLVYGALDLAVVGVWVWLDRRSSAG